MPGNPEGQRAQHYRYFIASIRNQLRHAGFLRIDHVAGLSRVFCVPRGMHARDGLYLTQPQEELHAILALEAERAGCVLVGEDLGTVPEAVRKAMQKRDFKRMYVLPFELEERAGETRARAVPERALAAINTHDMPTFAGFWHGTDIDERKARGVISAETALDEHEERRVLLDKLAQALELDPDVSHEDALSACLRFLGESKAHLVLVALEDLWGEREPQNVPGTFDPERNFSRRMRHPVDLLSRRGPALRLLELLSRARRGTSEQVSSLPA
jgi:4-alpha-glucanotransferase